MGPWQTHTDNTGQQWRLFPEESWKLWRSCRYREGCPWAARDLFHRSTWELWWTPQPSSSYALATYSLCEWRGGRGRSRSALALRRKWSGGSRIECARLGRRGRSRRFCNLAAWCCRSFSTVRRSTPAMGGDEISHMLGLAEDSSFKASDIIVSLKSHQMSTIWLLSDKALVLKYRHILVIKLKLYSLLFDFVYTEQSLVLVSMWTGQNFLQNNCKSKT